MFIEKLSLGYLGIAFWFYFGRSLVPLESLLVVFEGVEISSIIRRNGDLPRGPQDLRGRNQWRVKVLVQEGSK